MKKIVVTNIMNLIKKYNDFDDIKLQEIQYGIETIYLTIFKTILFIITSLIFNTIKELLMFILFYGIIRLTGFGVHAKKSSHCWISSIVTFIMIPILIKNLKISNNILYLLLTISMIILSAYAPADTEKRPLINKKKRIRYKLLTITISVIYIIVILLLPNNTLIKYSILYSLLLEGFLVTPFSYKLFGVPYKNYKNYKRKENKK